MKRSILAALAALAAVAWTVGCRTPASPTTVESYPHTRIILNSKIVASRLEVVETAATNRNSLLQAQIKAKNTTQQELQFEYRFRWQDAAGMAVPGGDTWAPVNVGARELVLMQGIAPASEVADFIFDVRFRLPGTRWE